MKIKSRLSHTHSHARTHVRTRMRTRTWTHPDAAAHGAHTYASTHQVHIPQHALTLLRACEPTREITWRSRQRVHSSPLIHASCPLLAPKSSSRTLSGQLTDRLTAEDTDSSCEIQDTKYQCILYELGYFFASIYHYPPLLEILQHTSRIRSSLDCPY